HVKIFNCYQRMLSRVACRKFMQEITPLALDLLVTLCNCLPLVPPISSRQAVSPLLQEATQGATRPSNAVGRGYTAVITRNNNVY
ncbi:MAG: hypothetical protein J07HX5_01927, partial [halophilic archaeon J07HX5]